MQYGEVKGQFLGLNRSVICVRSGRFWGDSTRAVWEPASPSEPSVPHPEPRAGSNRSCGAVQLLQPPHAEAAATVAPSIKGANSTSIAEFDVVATPGVLPTLKAAGGLVVDRGGVL